MPINNLDIVVFDFETSSANPKTTQPLSLAAVVLDSRNFELKSDAKFSSLIKPTDFSTVEKGALDVNKLTLKELEDAPEQSVVWKSFVDFVNKYNYKKSPFTSPIAAGHNILSFDMVIIERMCELYGPYNKKDGKGCLFNYRDKIDLMPMCYTWFNNVKDLENYKLDTLRKFLGIPTEGGHEALKDCIDTANIIARFLKYQRALIGNGEKFKGSFGQS